jgi:hypothetical protein
MKIILQHIDDFNSSSIKEKTFDNFVAFLYSYYGEKINKIKDVYLKNKYICIRARLIEYSYLKEKEIIKSIKKSFKKKIK